MIQDAPIIRMTDVHKAFGPVVVLDGINFEAPRGKTTVVIGPSGCGKSVLLKHVIGLMKPDSGEVWFRHHCISDLPESALVRVRRRIGFLFQGGALFDSMTVQENICFPLAEHNVETPAGRIEQSRRVLDLVGLNGLQNRYPEELSGGQKKRVALARAIALEPELILYDEPTTGLDPVRADLINELILKLQRTLGTTAIVVTHDMASARKVGDRIVMLHEGGLIVDATPQELDSVSDVVVQRFVQGRASPEELAQLQRGHVSAYNSAETESAAREPHQ